MPTVTVRLTPAQHARLRKRAELAGLSLADYVRQAVERDELAGMVREIHAAVVGTNGNGLSDEGRAALAVLVQLGEPQSRARRMVEAAIKAAPAATAENLLTEAYKHKET